MSEIIANDVRTKYDKAFATVRGILDAFPEDRWLVSHGDEYYLPCRIAYHIAVFIDGMIGGNSEKPDFRANLPFGSWRDGTAETLPNKKALIEYFEKAVNSANEALATITDENLFAPLPENKTRYGATAVGMHLQFMRELSDHTGEMNKMLIENGVEDIWVS